MLTRMSVKLHIGDELDRDELIQLLIESRYERNDTAPGRGEFSVSGDVVNVYPSYRDDYLRIEFFGDEIEEISMRDELNHTLLEKMNNKLIYKYWK